MRVCVVCKDIVIYEGLYVLLQKAVGASVLRTDGTLKALQELVQRPQFVVACPDSLDRKSQEQLSGLAAKLEISLIWVSSLTGEPLYYNSAGDKVVDRSLGAEGFRKILQNSPTNRYGKRRRKRSSFRSGLTAREFDVAKHIAQGSSNRQIASELGLQEQSVKNLTTCVMRKLNCENRVQVALHFASSASKIA